MTQMAQKKKKKALQSGWAIYLPHPFSQLLTQHSSGSGGQSGGDGQLHGREGQRDGVDTSQDWLSKGSKVKTGYGGWGPCSQPPMKPDPPGPTVTPQQRTLAAAFFLLPRRRGRGCWEMKTPTSQNRRAG